MWARRERDGSGGDTRCSRRIDEGVRGGEGGGTCDPSLPMGQRGVRWWGRGLETLQSLPRWVLALGESA